MHTAHTQRDDAKTRQPLDDYSSSSLYKLDIFSFQEKEKKRKAIATWAKSQSQPQSDLYFIIVHLLLKVTTPRQG